MCKPVLSIILNLKFMVLFQMFTTVITNLRMVILRERTSAILWRVLYYFIAMVLLFTGISKVIDPTPMIETMKAVFKVNENLLIIAATGLPLIEITLGLMLVLKIQTKRMLLGVMVLFFVFFAFSIYGTVIGLNVDCGCFGNAVKSEFGITMIIRNLVFTTVALLLAIVNKKFASAGRNL